METTPSRIPRVSVIVPGHNPTATLGACLSSLRNQDWPGECYEIIYVDDCSTDESVEIAGKLADRIVRLTGLPHGPAAARNAGVRESTGEVLLFIDADIIAPSDTVRNLLGPLMADDRLDAIFGSYDADPFHRTLVSQYRNLLHHHVHQISHGEASTFWAGCGAIRRTSFEKAGRFDTERYRTPMIEDIELGRRMRALDMRIRLEPKIQVKHLKRWTTLGMIRADIFCRGIPWMRLLLQDRRGSGEIGDLNLRVAAALSIPLTWGGFLLIPFTIVSLWFLAAAMACWGLVILLNLETYRFFRKARGFLFMVRIIPLHFIYHLCNGLSVMGAMLYRILFDRPIVGMKKLGASIRSSYWRWTSNRRRSVRPAANGSERGGR